MNTSMSHLDILVYLHIRVVLLVWTGEAIYANQLVPQIYPFLSLAVVLFIIWGKRKCLTEEKVWWKCELLVEVDQKANWSDLVPIDWMKIENEFCFRRKWHFKNAFLFLIFFLPVWHENPMSKTKMRFYFSFSFSSDRLDRQHADEVVKIYEIYFTNIFVKRFG